MKAVLILLFYILVTDIVSAKQLLVFSKTDGWRHASIEAGVKAIKKHAKQNSVDVVATEDATIFASSTLKEFDAILFLNSSGDVLNENQQIAFKQYINNGGGFAGVHAASDTEHNWPWYGKMVGGYFAGHPNNPNVRKGKIHVQYPSHQSTKMLPELWERSDEWYEFKQFNNNVKILLMVDEASYKKPEEKPAKGLRPISWYHEFDGGRSFYTGLGDTTESYNEPLFIEHLWGGIVYAMGE